MGRRLQRFTVLEDDFQGPFKKGDIYTIEGLYVPTRWEAFTVWLGVMRRKWMIKLLGRP